MALQCSIKRPPLFKDPFFLAQVWSLNIIGFTVIFIIDYIMTCNQYYITCLCVAPTTVQDISICQSGRTNYSIQCSYGNNSGVRGCGFVLVSREGENVMGYMEWDWDRGVVLDLPSFDYDNVLVFTLEEGNRIGGVPFRKSNSLIKFCVEYERKGTFYSFIVVQFYPLSVRLFVCLCVCPSIHPSIVLQLVVTPALSSSASAAVIGVLMLSAVVFIVTMWIVYVLRYEQGIVPSL